MIILPFEGTYKKTQNFGVNKESYSRYGLQGHNGVDYGMPVGTDIRSPHKGKVIEAQYDDTGYGMYIKIENDKEGSVLAHFSKILVQVGNEVSEGALIAKSGNTGNSTGPHLHWGWYLKPRNRSNGYNGFEDQLVIMKADKINYFPKPIKDCSQEIEKAVKEYKNKIIVLQNQLGSLKNKIINFVNNL